MRRIILAVHIKRGLFILFMVVALLVLLPIFIVGLGGNGIKRSMYPGAGGFGTISEDVLINESNNVGPKIRVYISSEDKIRELYLEEYIRGVVCAEMPANFDMEALKAQAVAARTFAVSHIPDFGGNSCSKGKGAHVCDTVHCQVYITKEKRFNDWPESQRINYWNKITQAVKETAGQVITYNSKLAMNARYFSVSSGKTEDALEVLALNEPYLKSVSSPGEEIAPKYKTSVKVTNSELAEKISKAYANSGVNTSNLKNQIKIMNRTSGGSVKEIKLGNTTITGGQFRNLLGLNSANFELTVSGKETEITCLGYGHGVGMSQWGANVMAKNGKNYVEILTHYYLGVKVERLKSA